jgi:hypothetical protein
MGQGIYLPSYPTPPVGAGIQPGFRQGGFGAGGGGGGGTVQVENYFNVPDQGSYVGNPAVGWEGELHRSGGGWGIPRDNASPPNYPNGNSVSHLDVSFWVRFNKALVTNVLTTIFKVGTHISNEHPAQVAVKRVSSGDGGIFLYYRKVNPWFNGDGGIIKASNFPEMFSNNQGQVILNKWFFVYTQIGSPNRAMVRTEEDTGEGTWYAGTRQYGIATLTNDSSTYRASIGTDAVASSSSNPYNNAVCRMDICNLRIGTYYASPTWWSDDRWRKQIDIDAERAIAIVDGRSADQANMQISYGYPMQADMACQGPYGPTWNIYSGALIPGTGPLLLAS